MPSPPHRPRPAAETEGDAPRPRTLWVVANSHLDTQWRWTVRDTIAEHLPRTLRECSARFATHPHFVLSFEGAFRYMLLREYDPEGFAEVRRRVAEGRWYPAGAMLDAPDVQVPSPESLLRHVLYGNRFFRRELGRASGDLFLPDCFGYGWALPSIAAHCGLVGFSGQKVIKWIAPAEKPFDIGLWRGPDGRGVVAVFDPGGYGDPIRDDPSASPAWNERVDRMAEATGLPIAYRYFGPRGDRGGAPDEESLDRLERAVERPRGLAVVAAASEAMFRDLGPSEVARLPLLSDEVLLPTHGTGCLTSQAAMKRWNRSNERLADAAERAAAIAHWSGALPYPRELLREAWIRFLWHQMHDDLTGTSVPEAYAISIADEALAANRFATVLEASVGAIARGLDTRPPGGAEAAGAPAHPLVVFNPLSVEREDVVEARVPLPAGDAVTVLGPDGGELPAQRAASTPDGRTRVLFLARLPPIGLAVFHVLPRPPATPADDGLEVAPDRLAGPFLDARLDERGEVASLVLRSLGREALAAPAGLALLPDRSDRWPAWEVLWEDASAEPRRDGRPAELEVVERGPARVAVRTRRRLAGSDVELVYRLGAGAAGERLEVAATIDWRGRATLLKAVFPLALSAPEATFDLGLGAIRRGNARREKYEVPAQGWADLTAPDGSWGVSILDDGRYGWDKPSDDTLRLSLLRAPRARRRSFRFQATQDFGRHRVTWALFPHRGGWQGAGTVWQSERIDQPLRAFRVEPSAGPWGRSFSFLAPDDPRVAVAALKAAEDDDRLILRLRETTGRPARGVSLGGRGRLRGLAELSGEELAAAERRPRPRGLELDVGGWEPRTLGLDLEPPEPALPPVGSRPLELPFDVVATSFHASPLAGDLDGAGRSLPGELFPPGLELGGVRFVLGPAVPGEANAVACAGQAVSLPPGEWHRVELIATRVAGDRRAAFRLLGAQGGEREAVVEVPDWSEPIARPNRWRRSWRRLGRHRLERATLEETPVAWVATHRHDRRRRDEPYRFGHLFHLRLLLPDDAERLLLPDDAGVCLFAASAVRDPHGPARWAGGGATGGSG